MPWKHVVCEGDDRCPGRVELGLQGDQSQLIVCAASVGQEWVFNCSMGALLGVQRGTRTYLAIDSAQCILSKEADGVHLLVTTTEGQQFRFFAAPHEYLLALSRLVAAKAMRKHVTLQ